MNLPYRDEQLIASAATGRDAAGIIAANAERLAARLPRRACRPAEVARRAWWGSPADIYLIVDNYERLAGSAPLTALVPLLEHAADIGLHLIVARQARGAARAVYDPLYATLKDVGTPALLLSGPETEGTVIGRTRLRPAPPGRGVWVPRRGVPRSWCRRCSSGPAPAAGRPHDRAGRARCMGRSDRRDHPRPDAGTGGVDRGAGPEVDAAARARRPTTGGGPGARC